MIYEWMCGDCSALTEVTCALKDYEIPPAAGCVSCGSSDVSRIISRPVGVKGFILEGSGWAHDGYAQYKPKPKRRDGFG